MINAENKRQEPAYQEGFNDALDFVLLTIKNEYKENKRHPSNSYCERAVSDVLIRLGSTIGKAKDDMNTLGYSSKISALLERVETEDQLFDEYVAAVHELYETRTKIKLTEKEIKKRNEKAKAILQKLLEKKMRRKK